MKSPRHENAKRVSDGIIKAFKVYLYSLLSCLNWRLNEIVSAKSTNESKSLRALLIKAFSLHQCFLRHQGLVLFIRMRQKFALGGWS